MKKNFINFAIIFLCAFFMGACQKLVRIPPPVGDLVASQVFSTDEQATSAVSGMYSKMINSNLGYASSGISLFTGMSSDELIYFNQSVPEYVQLRKNALTPFNSLVSTGIWSRAFGTIYQANSIISGLMTVNGVHDSVKNELLGESEFVRAFCNFYLTNLYGDIPLVSSTNYQKNGLLTRTPVSQIYQAILNDLKDAQNRLAPDYSVGQGQRIVPNRWVATALLAKVYLYTGDWQNAETQSTSLINNTLFGLCSDPGKTFLMNSTEAIWQLQQSNTTNPWFNITPEAYLLIPAKFNSNTNPPYAYVTPALLNSFEPGDTRRSIWIDSTNYRNKLYYFPYKYHEGAPSIKATGAYKEYYMVFRLAEQYLIRAEAEAQLGQDSAAILDLNTIRSRAGLPGYQGSTTKDSVLQAIYHERQVELFAEWGNRWLDLKRTGQATQILSLNKGFSVTSDMLLYPIPAQDLQVDPNLTQNIGY